MTDLEKQYNALKLHNDQLLARESFYKALYFQALVELRKANRGAARLSKRSDYFKEKYKETLEKLGEYVNVNAKLALETVAATD